MQRQVQTTEDGSKTIYLPQIDESYHSQHGAVQESSHIFIEMGLKPALAAKSNIHIFEMGLGTGLNLLLTALYDTTANIQYTAIEAYPIDADTAAQLGYGKLLATDLFDTIHNDKHWQQPVALTANLTMQLFATKLQDFDLQQHAPFDLVYFDAFSPDKQPELWTAAIFTKLFHVMAKGGILVTYCAKGSVKRALKEAGFTIEALPGPPGKREITRATKP